MDKRELWFKAMENVARQHHELIVDEYNRLCKDAGTTSMPNWRESIARQMLLDTVRPGTRKVQLVQAINAYRDKTGESLKASKDMVDGQKVVLIAMGMIEL